LKSGAYDPPQIQRLTREEKPEKGNLIGEFLKYKFQNTQTAARYDHELHAATALPASGSLQRIRQIQIADLFD